MGYFHGPSLATANNRLPLSPQYYDAVAASSRHAEAGFMAPKSETEAGVGDMQSHHTPAVYGDQLWNYFERSYPKIMQRYYPNPEASPIDS